MLSYLFVVFSLGYCLLLGVMLLFLTFYISIGKPDKAFQSSLESDYLTRILNKTLWFPFDIVLDHIYYKGFKKGKNFKRKRTMKVNLTNNKLNSIIK